MSLGFSLADIRLGWQLGTFLYEKCFTKAQGAASSVPKLQLLFHSCHYVQYLKFGREIESFAENLQQIEGVINHTNRQRPRRRWRDDPDDECRLALQPVFQTVGDFKKTLDECQKLLNDHERFQRDAAGFVDNVVWHISTQRDVDILRERVRFHATKLLIISKPFEIQLLLEIRQELQYLRRDVSEIKRQLDRLLVNGDPSLDPWSLAPTLTFPEIPDEIIAKFVDLTSFEPPATFQDLSHMPLKEGFDALVYHFSQSTVEFNPGFDLSQRTPEETQFVNLLKSKWILDLLEHSPELTAVTTAPLWASALMEIKSEKCLMGHQWLKQIREIWQGHAADVASAKFADPYRGPDHELDKSKTE
ncbi:MAG: hypothetical protein Q9186_005337 [Xanthomendoza sp. 1 TL-2023]